MLTYNLRLQVRFYYHGIPVIFAQVTHQVTLLYEGLVALRAGEGLVATV